MLRVRSRLSVSHRSDDVLAVQISIVRRLIFGAIAVLLLASFVVSVDFEQDFQSNLIAGLIFYFSITAVCVGIAGWNSVKLLDRRQREIRYESRLFGIPLKRKILSEVTVEAVTVQTVKLIRESEKPREGMFGRPLRGYLEKRGSYHKLYLDTAERRLILEDSTEITDLQQIGQGLAEFYRVAYKVEEV